MSEVLSIKCNDTEAARAHMAAVKAQLIHIQEELIQFEPRAQAMIGVGSACERIMGIISEIHSKVDELVEIGNKAERVLVDKTTELDELENQKFDI